MKYKVGDKVRIINNDDNDFNIGEVATIDATEDCSKYNVFLTNERNHEWVRDEDITSFDYTWEDFLKAPVGTKVTFESGKHLFKVDKDENGDEFANIRDNFSYKDLEYFKFEDIDYGKIIKIEEPTYTIVYEPKEVTMPEIEEMKRLTDELCKTCDEFIKKIKEIKDE